MKVILLFALTAAYSSYFLLFSGLRVIFIVYGNVRIYCLVAECRWVSQVWGKVRWASFISPNHGTMLISDWLTGPSLVSHWPRVSNINLGVQQNKSLFFSPLLKQSGNGPSVHSADSLMWHLTGDNSVYHCHAGDHLTAHVCSINVF